MKFARTKYNRLGNLFFDHRDACDVTSGRSGTWGYSRGFYCPGEDYTRFGISVK